MCEFSKSDVSFFILSICEVRLHYYSITSLFGSQYINFTLWKFAFLYKKEPKMYEVFEQLLQKFGVTTADVCKATGIGQSTMSNWKSRRNLISGKNAQLIADYFKVSVDYLMTGKEKDGEEKYYINDETAEIAQKIFQSKELKVLFDAAQDAQPEDLDTVYQMLLALKRKERGEDN